MTHLAGSTLGILGLGRLGQRVAAIAQLFGMEVIAWSENLTVAAASQLGVQRVEKAELFRRSDIVSIHTLQSHRTRGLVRAGDLELLGPAGYLVNTSRGPIVEEKALIEALQSKHLAGAALDVFENEPLPSENPLMKMDNVMLAPHNSNSSPAAWERVHWNTIKNLVEGLGLRYEG